MSPDEEADREAQAGSKKNIWYARFVDPGDRSGDLFLTLPPDLVDQLGWKEGDVITVDKDAEDNIWLKKR